MNIFHVALLHCCLVFYFGVFAPFYDTISFTLSFLRPSPTHTALLDPSYLNPPNPGALTSPTPLSPRCNCFPSAHPACM